MKIVKASREFKYIHILVENNKEYDAFMVLFNDGKIIR